MSYKTYVMILENINTIIEVDRSIPFEPHPFLTEEYGTMSIAWQNPIASKITSFDLDKDVSLYEIGASNLLSGEELCNKLPIEYIPLDGHCMKAIWEKKDLFKILYDKWWRGIYSTPRLETINCLGTLLTDKSVINPLHIMCFKYGYEIGYSKLPIAVTLFEMGDEAWGAGDPVLVFNPNSQLIKNLVH
jgi:hypothetical protein